jgi:hypothetical protein
MRTILYANRYAMRIFGSDRRSQPGAFINVSVVDCCGEPAWLEL